MFRIGEFSRIARVSCRLLRYYDELGLLRPARVDDDTGYRFYSASQLGRLNRILVLKELGLSLEQIAKILADALPAAELRGMLMMRRAEVERALENEALRLRHIESRIEQLENEGCLLADDIVIRSEPEQRVLGVRRRVTSFADAKRIVAGLQAELPKVTGGAKLGRLVVIAHGETFEPDDLELEVGFFVTGEAGSVTLADGGIAEVRTAPAVEYMATCVRIGPVEEAHRATASIGRFVEGQGLRLAGPSREVFLQRLRPERPEASVVEMQFPVERVAQ